MSDDRSSSSSLPLVRRALAGRRWQGAERLAYKREGEAPFKDITRQLLFNSSDLGCELRYFEMEPGGFSTLERHYHAHAVMILTGSGHCLIGGEVYEVSERDLVSIPPMTWHQFRATGGQPFGFLCLVNRERDRPQLPAEAELAELRSSPEIAAFLDGRIGAEAAAGG